MDAIVLAGGMGTRVQAITKDLIPKILIPVNGKPFIDYLLNVLKSNDVRRVIFAAGHKGRVLKDYVDYKYTQSNINIEVVIEHQPLDTAGAVLNILNKNLIQSNPFLVLNGDCFIFPDGEDNYEELYYSVSNYGKPQCAMFTCYMNHDGRYGSLVMDPDGWISEFKNSKANKSWINCGWYILRHSFFNQYKQKKSTVKYEVKKLSMEQNVFIDFLDSGQLISPIIIGKDQFVEIGTEEALERSSKQLKEL